MGLSSETRGELDFLDESLLTPDLRFCVSNCIYSYEFKLAEIATAKPQKEHPLLRLCSECSRPKPILPLHSKYAASTSSGEHPFSLSLMKAQVWGREGVNLCLPEAPFEGEAEFY